jgi:hypothetical protein
MKRVVERRTQTNRDADQYHQHNFFQHHPDDVAALRARAMRMPISRRRRATL